MAGPLDWWRSLCWMGGCNGKRCAAWRAGWWPTLTPARPIARVPPLPTPPPFAPQCRARRLRGRRRRGGRRGSASRRASAARRPWTCSSACWPPPSSCSPPAARAPPPPRLAWWRGTGGPGPCAAGWGPRPAVPPAHRRPPPGPPRTSPRGAPARLGRSSRSLSVAGAAGSAAGAPGEAGRGGQQRWGAGGRRWAFRALIFTFVTMLRPLERSTAAREAPQGEGQLAAFRGRMASPARFFAQDWQCRTPVCADRRPGLSAPHARPAGPATCGPRLPPWALIGSRQFASSSVSYSPPPQTGTAARTLASTALPLSSATPALQLAVQAFSSS